MRDTLLLLVLTVVPASAQGPAMSELFAAAGPAYAPFAAPAAKAAPVPAAPPVARAEGIIIKGGAPFAAAAREALALLKTSRSFGAIRMAIGEIDEYACSGMDVYSDPPTFRVGAATWQAGAVWFAGAIAHDARHAQLYAAAKKGLGGLEPPPEQWKETAGEQFALDYQAGVLRELGAPAAMLQRLEVLRADPIYQNIGKSARAPYNPLSKPKTDLNCRGRNW